MVLGRYVAKQQTLRLDRSPRLFLPGVGGRNRRPRSSANDIDLSGRPRRSNRAGHTTSGIGSYPGEFPHSCSGQPFAEWPEPFETRGDWLQGSCALGKAVLGAAGDLPCPVASLIPRFAADDKGDRRWIFCHRRRRYSALAFGLSKHGATVLCRLGKIYWSLLHKFLIY